jgi:NAD(P)-dependent dehydrogenase (short-subunit alcohol dehydrogenase family)
VNFRAHWTAMTAEAALMRRDGGGAIVNTSSIGSRRANPELPAYGAMKRALNSITETAAVTWAPHGIRVNGITPGGTGRRRRGRLKSTRQAVVVSRRCVNGHGAAARHAAHAWPGAAAPARAALARTAAPRWRFGGWPAAEDSGDFLEHDSFLPAANPFSRHPQRFR